MSTGLKIFLVFPVFISLLLLGVYIYGRILNIDPTDPAHTGDPLLKQFQLANPQLGIEDEFSRLPVYWIREPGSSRKILFPRSEADGAKVRLTACDLTRIPARLLYPNYTEITCLELDNDAHKLSVFYFRTKDRIKKVVDFYEAPLDPSRHFGSHRDTYSERREEDNSRAFLFSYFLYEAVDTKGFVGYREERK
jgi:hypothetical protein